MRVRSSSRLVAMAAAAALGSVGIVLTTTPAADAGPATYSNPTTITITDNADATPYPSPIAVSGLGGAIVSVTVTLTGFSHESMLDVGIVLVAPNGDALAIMDGVGTSVDVNNLNLTISDSAATLLPAPTISNPTSGSYRPASYRTGDVFPAPGPGGAYERPATDGTATFSSVFGGDDPNGTWNLFVRDFASGDSGSISGGWSLSITTTTPLQDGGFEAGTGNPIDSPAWTEADNQFGSPICSVLTCGTGGEASPRTGDNWAWFGGVPVADHISSISQDFLIPAGPAALTYWYRNGTVSAPFDAVLLVKVDGTTVKTHNEETTAQAAYSEQTVDLSAYADGASHTLSFEFDSNTGAATSSMVVDDVSIDRVTETPSVDATEPASPNQSPFPQVVGTAEEGSTVTLFTNDTCTSASIASGIRNDFETIGIPVTVPENATTTIYARASKAGQLDSACSSTFVSYTHDSIAPDPPHGLAVSPASPNQSSNPAITGTAEAGSIVKVYRTADCSGTQAATDTAAVFGSFGLLPGVGPNTTTTFKATATDAAGNTSPCSTSSVTYVMDVSPPALVTLDSVSPSSPDPDTTPIITGTAEAGSTVNLYTTSDCTGTPWQTGTAATFGSTGLTATVATDSTTTFKATATDAAGNTSDCSTSSLTYVNDSTAPDLVTFGSVTPASPNPSTAPVVRGTAEPGSAVSLYTTADCSGTPWQTGTAATFASSGLTASVGANTTTTFKATATDPAGNTSGCSTSSVTYVSDSTAPGEVTLTSATPASPNPSTTPTISGDAEPGATVDLYTTPDCTGAPVATGTAAELSSPGLTATVGVGSTTTFKATATDLAGNTSGCSSSSVTYVQQNPASPPPAAPETTLTKTPKKKVTTTKSKAKVSFSFSSATAGATFQCSIDGQAFSACTSGKTFKVQVGKHTFAVRAVASGQTDPTPATYSFKVKRRSIRP